MEATALSMGKSVLSGALGYAKSAVAEEVALQLGVTRDQAFVRDELEMMLSFLMAAHEERDKRMVVETWVKQVRVVAYDVEDSIMDFAVRVEKKSWWVPWRIPRNLRYRRHVAKQMKDLRAKVEDVSQRRLRYRLITEGSSSKTAAATDTAASAAAMFGINEARYAAKTKDQPRVDLAQLINKQSEDLGVIAVWGTSGNVGHMSIIWEAYENSATVENFQCRAWVRVMHPFNPKEFIRSLLEEAVGVDFLMETEKTGQALVEEFLAYVNDKRCLIVLDDLSTIQDWNRVRKCFPINKKGNRVIVSPTNAEVASLCVGQNSVAAELKQLSVDQPIYAFYVEPIARQSVQTSTMNDLSQQAAEDGNTGTKRCLLLRLLYFTSKLLHWCGFEFSAFTWDPGVLHQPPATSLSSFFGRRCVPTLMARRPLQQPVLCAAPPSRRMPRPRSPCAISPAVPSSPAMKLFLPLEAAGPGCKKISFEIFFVTCSLD